LEAEGCLYNVMYNTILRETKLKTIQNSKISRGTHVERMTADTFTIADVAPVSQIFGA
jgi:hypothetical protein